MGTVVFDFDGVIHSYKNGWHGDSIIDCPPVPGIAEAIRDIRSAGYEIVVISTRCASEAGRRAIWEWLNRYEITVDDVTAVKVPAKVYVDDRALLFDGHPENLLEQIDSFEPWLRKRRTDA